VTGRDKTGRDGGQQACVGGPGEKPRWLRGWGGREGEGHSAALAQWSANAWGVGVVWYAIGRTEALNDDHISLGTNTQCSSG
jgi:hypothetical protein